MDTTQQKLAEFKAVAEELDKEVLDFREDGVSRKTSQGKEDS